MDSIRMGHTGTEIHTTRLGVTQLTTHMAALGDTIRTGIYLTEVMALVLVGEDIIHTTVVDTMAVVGVLVGTTTQVAQTKTAQT